MEWVLDRKLSLRKKPIIRRVFGKWVCFIRINETDLHAANKARAWCEEMNGKGE